MKKKKYHSNLLGDQFPNSVSPVLFWINNLEYKRYFCKKNATIFSITKFMPNLNVQQ